MKFAIIYIYKLNIYLVCVEVEVEKTSVANKCAVDDNENNDDDKSLKSLFSSRVSIVLLYYISKPLKHYMSLYLYGDNTINFQQRQQWW